MLGITIMAERLSEVDNLIERLRIGDPELVVAISGFVPGWNKFSFASKFCAYMCRYLFADGNAADNYAIYDGVLADMLPYYALKYGNTERRPFLNRNSKSTIETEFRKTRKYKEYRDLIDEILDGVYYQKGIRLSREEFDSMIWYYYKGVSKEIQMQMMEVKFI